MLFNLGTKKKLLSADISARLLTLGRQTCSPSTSILHPCTSSNSQANPDDPWSSNTWDAIVGGREICSGSQRINSHDELCETMREDVCGAPLDPEAEKWHAYMTAFKAGIPSHGGVAWV